MLAPRWQVDGHALLGGVSAALAEQGGRRGAPARTNDLLDAL